MSLNYSPNIPRDSGGAPLYNSPAPRRAGSVTSIDNASASSIISFSHAATTIEVAAVGGGAAIRWVPTTETAGVAPFASVITTQAGANFDHVVSTGTIRSFTIPIETMSGTLGSIVGINRREGLFQRIAVKGFGVSSVLLSEY